MLCHLRSLGHTTCCYPPIPVLLGNCRQHYQWDITQVTNDNREKAFLYQRLSVVIQRYNAVIIDTFAQTTTRTSSSRSRLSVFSARQHFIHTRRAIMLPPTTRFSVHHTGPPATAASSAAVVAMAVATATVAAVSTVDEITVLLLMQQEHKCWLKQQQLQFLQLRY